MRLRLSYLEWSETGEASKSRATARLYKFKRVKQLPEHENMICEADVDEESCARRSAVPGRKWQAEQIGTATRAA